MLKLYRRHRVACGHTDQAYRRCSCPIYVKGTLFGPAGDTAVRMSMRLTDWDQAVQRIAAWTETGTVGQTDDPTMKPLPDVVAAFLEDVAARGLAPATSRKYRTLLTGKLLTWTAASGYRFLVDLTVPRLSTFRGTWGAGPLARQKDQERLIAFFRWCRLNGYTSTNPAEGLSSIKVTHVPTLPFTAADMTAILAAIDQYPTFNTYGYDNRARVLAFVLLLRWTGLRMQDVVRLRWTDIQDGTVFLYTQKTGTPVRIPVPPAVTAALEQLPKDGTRVFWNGKGTAESACSVWRRALRTVFTEAKIVRGHAHRFRDTFAVALLLSGVELPDVSILLGHSSIRITERSYAPWVATRQTRLEAAVLATWGSSAPGSLVPPAPSPADAPAAPPTPESGTPVPA